MNDVPFLILGVAAAWVGLMVAMRDRAVTSRHRAFVGAFARIGRQIAMYGSLGAVAGAQLSVLLVKAQAEAEAFNKAMRQIGASAREADAAMRRFHDARVAEARARVAGPKGRLP